VEAMTMGDRIVIMNGGKIMQVATPLEAYNKPQNRFVAGFIGTPPMNFFSGEWVDGTVQLGGGVKLPFPRSSPDGLKSIVFGIRPEHIYVRPAGKRGETPLGYALVLPAVLYLGIFIAYPFLMSIWMSFSDAQAGNQKWTWTGWANYSKVEAYDVLANSFHLAQFKEKNEAEAFLAQRDK